MMIAHRRRQYLCDCFVKSANTILNDWWSKMTFVFSLWFFFVLCTFFRLTVSINWLLLLLLLLPMRLLIRGCCFCYNCCCRFSIFIGLRFYVNFYAMLRKPHTTSLSVIVRRTADIGWLYCLYSVHTHTHINVKKMFESEPNEDIWYRNTHTRAWTRAYSGTYCLRCETLHIRKHHEGKTPMLSVEQWQQRRLSVIVSTAEHYTYYFCRGDSMNFKCFSLETFL